MKNNNIKKMATIGLFGIILGTTLTVSAGTLIQAYRNDEIKVTLNGELQTFRDVTTNEIEVPLTYNNRTYLPLRSLATLVGLNVNYDANTKTAILETKDYVKNNDNIEKEKIEWLKIKQDEEMQISLNNKVKKIKCSIHNAKTSSETGIVNGLVTFTDIDNKKECSLDFQKSDMQFEIGKIVDIATNEEYLILAIGYRGKDSLVICNENMEICARFTRPYGENFQNVAIFEGNEKISYPIDEKYYVPIEECYNTEIVYYDLYGMEKEYLDNISYEYEAYKKNENEHIMTKRRITIKNGVIKDNIVNYYKNYVIGNV